MDGSSSTSSSEPRGRRAFVEGVLGLGALGLGALVWPRPEAVRGGAVVRTPFDGLRFDIDPRWIAGVSRPSRVTTNAMGLRGNLVGDAPRDLLMIGGSTAQCLLLDDADSLDARLEIELRARGLAGARVANAGFAGHPIEALLAELPSFEGARRPAKILGLFGANEVEYFINHAPWATAPNGAMQPGYDLEGPYGPAHRARTFAGWYRPGSRGRFLVRPREAYAQARKTEAMPSHLRAFLAERSAVFGQALAQLADFCAQRRIELVLATQPVDPSEGGRDPTRGWSPFFFAPPGQGFVPSPSLMRGLVAGFNEMLRRFAAARSLALVDLAAEVSREGCFYDQWHFSVEGAQRAATQAGEALAALEWA